MAERTIAEEIEFVRKCLRGVDEPDLEPLGQKHFVRDAKEALDRIRKKSERIGDMPEDGKMMRDLWSASRHMQTNMHHIASQVWALKSVLERLSIRDEQVLKIVGNIKELAEYCYGRGKKEELCFPNVCDAIFSAKARMEERGIWREWSDDIGFPKEKKSNAQEGK